MRLLTYSVSSIVVGLAVKLDWQPLYLRMQHKTIIGVPMIHIATCHCGETCITMPNLPEKATLCNCTFCTKRGVLWGYFRPEDVKVEVGKHDRIYEPSGINHHHFCSNCGCSTWSLTPDWSAIGENDSEPPKRLSVNLCLLDDTDIRKMPVEMLDGLSSW